MLALALPLSPSLFLSPSLSPVPLPCCLLAATTATTVMMMTMVLAGGLIHRMFCNALYLERYLTWHIDHHYYHHHHHLLLLYHHHHHCYHRHCRSQPRRCPSLGLASRPPSGRINSGSRGTGPLTGRPLSTMYLQSRANGSQTSRRWWALRTPLTLGGLWRRS